MSRIFTWLRLFAQREPAVFSWSTVALALPVLAQVLGWDTRQAAAAAAAAAALAAAVTAARARPAGVGAITGGVAAAVAALAAWHLKVPGTDVARVCAGLALALGLLLRGNLTPAVTLREQARQQSSAGGGT